ncbi:MAG: hypothetical protein KME26_28985 [Oscillatoria princeps RMCB-10]|nr:hypothetical protein [Oscillatoria princeps RMCB-10]
MLSQISVCTLCQTREGRCEPDCGQRSAAQQLRAAIEKLLAHRHGAWGMGHQAWGMGHHGSWHARFSSASRRAVLLA